MAPFWDPGVRPHVISPKNEWICLCFARKAQKWRFSASGGTQGPISFATSQLLEYMDRLFPLYVGPPGPKDFGKAPFVNFGPANLENTGDKSTVSDSAISGLSPISYTIRENPNSANLWQAAM